MKKIRDHEINTFRFTRKEHLKGKKEIKAVFGSKKVSCQGAKLFFLENKLPYNRICFTFPGKFGNAVARNRARRLGREAFRLLKSRISTGFDMILLVYPETGMVLFDRIKQFEILFSKAGILR